MAFLLYLIPILGGANPSICSSLWLLLMVDGFFTHFVIFYFELIFSGAFFSVNP